MRACYAALRMQQAVGRYAEGVRRREGVPIRIRVGLNSGEVVVRSIGSDLHMDYTAVGQTTHLAAWMEQIADPGAIVITPDTLALAVPSGPWGFVRRPASECGSLCHDDQAHGRGDRDRRALVSTMLLESRRCATAS